MLHFIKAIYSPVLLPVFYKTTLTDTNAVSILLSVPAANLHLQCLWDVRFFFCALHLSGVLKSEITGAIVTVGIKIQSGSMNALDDEQWKWQCTRVNLVLKTSKA